MTPPKDMNALMQANPSAFPAIVDGLMAQEHPSLDLTSAPEFSRAPGFTSMPVFDPAAARSTIAQLEAAASKPPAFVVENLLPVDTGILVGPGSTGKTSLILWECAHITLGRPLYGHDIAKPGPVLYLTQEDSRDKLQFRLKLILDELNLSPAEREHAVQSFYIEDVTEHRTRLVESDERGNLTCTPTAEQLIDAYTSVGPSLLVLDPFVYFGPGERHMNDGGAETMLVGRRISRALGCAVEFVGHCSIQTSRDKQTDQYAGRSAAAIADNARFVRNLYSYASTDGKKFGCRPSAATPDDIANKRVMVLNEPKISDAPPITEPIWILRRGWSYTHLPNELQTAEDMERDEARRICTRVQEDERREVWHTGKTIETQFKTFGLRRDALRDLLRICDQRGWLIPVELPEGDPWRKGQRTHRLSVGMMP